MLLLSATVSTELLLFIILQYLSVSIIHNIFNSIARLELKLKQMEIMLLKAREQLIVETNNNNKNELTIKRLKKQNYIITWVYINCMNNNSLYLINNPIF